jgi:NCS1 family nucleobase:cation symporter-1
MVPKSSGTGFRYWAKRFECPVDEDAGYHNTFWCNRDLIPIPSDRRTWDWTGYAGYWVITGINTTAWTFGSSLLSLGLSVPQAMGVSVGCSLLVAIIAVIAGWAGSHQHLGFTVMCRSSWGIRGGFWPVLNRIMTAIIWLGIQMYWGGQAIKIILGALIGPKVRDARARE